MYSSCKHNVKKLHVLFSCVTERCDSVTKRVVNVTSIISYDGPGFGNMVVLWLLDTGSVCTGGRKTNVEFHVKIFWKKVLLSPAPQQLRS